MNVVIIKQLIINRCKDNKISIEIYVDIKDIFSWLAIDFIT